MPKALLLENIHPDAAQSLRDHGFEVECLKAPSTKTNSSTLWKALTFWVFDPKPA